MSRQITDEELSQIDSTLPRFPSFGEAIQVVWRYVWGLPYGCEPETYHWRNSLHVRRVDYLETTMTVWTPDHTARFRLAFVEHDEMTRDPVHMYDMKISNPRLARFIASPEEWVVHPTWNGRLADLSVLKTGDELSIARSDWKFFTSLRQGDASQDAVIRHEL